MRSTDLHKLSLENGRNSGIEVPRRNTPLPERLAECVELADEAATNSKAARKAKSGMLQRVYEVSLAAADHHEELFALAKRRELPVNRATDLFGLVIKMVTDDAKWARTRVSEYARALQYLHSGKTPIAEVPAKLKELGGTRRAAALLAKIRNAGEGSEDPADKVDQLWKRLKNEKPIVLKDSKARLDPGRQILVAYVNDKKVKIHWAVSAKSLRGVKVLREIAPKRQSRPRD